MFAVALLESIPKEREAHRANAHRTRCRSCWAALLILACAANLAAAPTFPTQCVAFPDDCAGAALASRYSTRGLVDFPLPFNPAVHPPEMQMFRATIDLALFPEAVCNDGSPAVFYFAEAPAGSINADKWVVQLEGGGGCLEAVDEDGLHQDCMDRWTGRGPDLLDFPRKMSTDLDSNGVADPIFLPFEGRFSGLLGPDSVVTDPTLNGGLDAWNRIFINYCSSDLWIGQSGAIVLDDGEWTDAGGAQQVYEPLDEAWFNGHLIVESVFDALAAGVLSDDQEGYIRRDAVPEEILIAGDSAGGGGVATNLDFIASKAGWGSDFAGNDLANTMGVAGSNMKPPYAYDDSTLPWYSGPTTVQEWDYSSSPAVLVDVDLDGNGVVDDHDLEAGAPLRRPVYEFLLNAFLDESCATANTDPLAPDPNQRHWLCYRTSSLYPGGYITTPILVKQDLADPLTGGGIPAYGEGIRTMMSSLASNFEYFGPRCGHHETLTHQGRFNGDRVIDALGIETSYHRAISWFLAGTYSSIFFDPGVTGTACAP